MPWPIEIVCRWATGMVIVLSVLFLLMEALPGDFADSIAGADRERAARLRVQRGLDAPVLQRLGSWWAGVLQGDLGTSLMNEQAVAPRVFSGLAATLVVALPATILAALLAVAVSFLMAWLRGRRSGIRLAAGVAVIAGLPEVVLVILLVLLLAVTWRLVPAVSLISPGTPILTRPQVLVLPILALAIPHAAWGARMLRGSADDILAGDVVMSARRRGVPMGRIALSHVLPRWRGPIAQVTAYLAAGILGGSVVVESMLAYPGLGELLSGAVASRDIPTVQGVGTVIVGVSLVLLTCADLLARRAA
ncbi:MAG: ABC transporter permease [Propionibacteriaceae bacterium]|nr:ABC transporter permease [Propionibacteriaceae bacterium]